MAPRPRLLEATATARLRLPGLLLLLCGCAAGSATSSTHAPANDERGPPPLAPVSEAKAAYYRRAFSSGARWVPRAIPGHMLRSADQGNDTYVEAFDAQGARLGYLRDFVGPLSTRADCPCDPLNITLVFDASAELTTLISPVPLTKYGHAPMTDEDVRRLIELIKNPPKELMAARTPDEVVDATTGATKDAFKSVVVAQAGLETRRLAGLVQDTQAILREAPVTWDRARLEQLLRITEPAARARALAEFLPEAQSDDAAIGALRLMARDYAEAQQKRDAGDPLVESRLLDAATLQRVGVEAIYQACFALAEKGLRADFAERCATTVDASGAPLALVARMRGTSAFERGALSEALPLLEKAAGYLRAEQDPELHGRLARALERTGRHAEACREVARLYPDQALLPAVVALLPGCRADKSLNEELDAADAKAKRTLLASLREDGAPAPTLSLEDDALNPVELALAAPGKLTVVVFFATWCPHCQTELPKLVAFSRKLAADARLSGRVRIVAVRTAVEREVESYPDFKRRLSLDLPIYTDATMSLAFSRFAKAHDVAAGLPTLAVADERGVVRFFLENGEFKDLGRELGWALEALLAR